MAIERRWKDHMLDPVSPTTSLSHARHALAERLEAGYIRLLSGLCLSHLSGYHPVPRLFRLGTILQIFPDRDSLK